MTNELPGGSTPSQYGLPPNATELQDLIEHRGMNFAVGNIFKAAYRLGRCSHSDQARDLRKIIWFAERELARVEEANVGAVGAVEDNFDMLKTLALSNELKFRNALSELTVNELQRRADKSLADLLELGRHWGEAPK
jgi:hypothetical protein